MARPSSTVLVTGGSGYLGGWCVAELLNRGHTVRTTVRDLTREAEVRAAVGSQADAGDNLTFIAADLSGDEGWAEAVTGCQHILHVASPFPPAQPKNPDDLIVPARDGALRVLRAGLDAGVERIVMTSSVAAISGGPAKPVLDEEDWTDPENPSVSPYAQSKTIAEREAWRLVEESGEAGRLAAINPGAILGPVLSADTSFSLELVQRLFSGIPGVPRIGYSVVDVRDVADLHIRAMTAPEAGGKRFIAVEQWQWMADVAQVLRDRLGDRAKKVPTRSLPNILVRAMGLIDPGVRSITGQLGVKREFSSERARTLLGWSARPVEDTIAETAESLMAVGAIKS